MKLEGSSKGLLAEVTMTPDRNENMYVKKAWERGEKGVRYPGFGKQCL